MGRRAINDSEGEAPGTARRAWVARLPVEQLVLALIYFYAARIALLFAFEKTNASPFWPPAGVAFTALIIGGPHAWTGIFVGAFVANLVTFLGNGLDHLPRLLVLSLLIGLGNACGAAFGWLLSGRPSAKAGLQLDTLGTLRILLGGFGAASFSAAVGSTAVALSGAADAALWPTIARIWMVGDAAGIVFTVPLALSWWCDEHADRRRLPVGTAYAIIAGCALCQLAFGRGAEAAIWLMPLAPLCGLLRGSRRELWTSAAFAACLLIWQTVRGAGPCASDNEAIAMLQLQLTLLISGTLLLILDGLLIKKAGHEREHGFGLVFDLRRSDVSAGMLPALSLMAVGTLITLVTWSSIIKDQAGTLREHTLATATNFSEHFVAEAANAGAVFHRMAERWHDAGGTPEAAWRKDALNVVRAFDYLQAVEWVDRQGVVRWVEPLEQNRSVLGLNLTGLPDRAVAFAGRQRGPTVAFTPIVALRQGVKGFLVTAPIGAGDDADGFIVGVVHLDRFVRHLARRTEAARGTLYDLQLIQDGRSIFTLAGADRAHTEFAQTHRIDVFPKPVQVRTWPRDAAVVATASSLPSLVLNAGLLLSTLLGLSVALVYIALAHARLSLDASRAKARFLAMMSHEIRTPLNAILGSTELALLGPLRDETREQLSLISSSSRGLLAIINDILDFSKIEAGKFQLESIPLDLREIIQQCVELFRAPTAQRGLALESSVQPELPRTILGDPVRLRQIVLNLLSNALKFTQQGRVALHVSTVPAGPSEAGASSPSRLRITCEDSGIGMDAQTQSQLFSPFTQGDASTTRRFGGTGLGLAIVHQLVQQMQGSITCTSEPGRGACFVIELPLRRTDLSPVVTPRTTRAGLFASSLPPAVDSQLRVTSLPPARTNSPVPTGANIVFEAEAETPVVRPRVLLVEDNFVNQRVASALLARLGCAVEVAADGREAVQLCAERSYDLVLMDMQMPILDGIEASRQIRAAEAEGKRVPIVALSASVFSEDEARCREAGMDDFLAKPVSMDDLRRVVGHFARNVPAQPHEHVG